MWKAAQGLIGISLLSAPALLGQVVETFPVDFGSPRFGEQPWIRGNLVVWQRYGKGDNFSTGFIQCKDITRVRGPVINVAPRRGDAAMFLSGSHLFWRTPNVLSRPLDQVKHGLEGINRTVVVGSDRAQVVVASTSRHAFFVTGNFSSPTPGTKQYFARCHADFGPSPLQPSELVTEFRAAHQTTRLAAASDQFFVWQDRDPDSFLDTWKIYAKRMEDLFTPGAEKLVIDTDMDGLGSYLDVHENLLVFQKAERINEPGEGGNFPWGVYLLDLEAGGEPVAVTHGEEEPRVWPDWPAISEHYIVWARVEGFFSRTAYARRHAGGELQGEAFPIGPGGSWIKIDRNIAVWNGSTSFENGDVRHAAIMAAELELPGAEDVGDVNQDGALNLTDAVVILRFLFGDGWRPRLRLADADRSGTIELTDAIVILRYLFQGGERPGV